MSWAPVRPLPGEDEGPKAPPSAPDLSIVIVNRNTADLLHACLRSLRADDPGLSLEIIVVDNGSTDASVEMVRRDFPEVRLIENETNEGFAIPNNQGMAVARGRHMMLLNSDTEVRAGAIGSLVEVIDAEPGIGAVGPALFLADGRRQRSAFSFKTPWRHFCDMAGLGYLFPRSTLLANQNVRLDFARAQDVDWLIGAAIVVRGSVIESVGGLDERFRIHCNDDDWCRRIHEAGYRVRYHPDAEVLHHSGSTIRAEADSAWIEDELVRNLFDYHRKYSGAAGVLWLRIWMVAGYGARAVIALLRRVVPGNADAEQRAVRFGKLAFAGLVGPRASVRTVTTSRPGSH